MAGIYAAGGDEFPIAATIRGGTQYAVDFVADVARFGDGYEQVGELPFDNGQLGVWTLEAANRSIFEIQEAVLWLRERGRVHDIIIHDPDVGERYRVRCLGYTLRMNGNTKRTLTARLQQVAPL